MIQEVGGHPHLRLAGESEAWDILRVDLRRSQFVTRRDALGVHGRQRPVLAGQKVQAKGLAEEIIPVHRAVEVTNARLVAVGFVGIGGLRRRVKVELAVHGQMHVRRGVALDQGAEAALVFGQAVLVGVAGNIVGEGNLAEVGGDVRHHVVRTIDVREFGEASEGDAQALVIELVRLGLGQLADGDVDLLGDSLQLLLCGFGGSGDFLHLGLGLSHLSGRRLLLLALRVQAGSQFIDLRFQCANFFHRTAFDDDGLGHDVALVVFGGFGVRGRAGGQCCNSTERGSSQERGLKRHRRSL